MVSNKKDKDHQDLPFGINYPQHTSKISSKPTTRKCLIWKMIQLMFFKIFINKMLSVKNSTLPKLMKMTHFSLLNTKLFLIINLFLST